MPTFTLTPQGPFTLRTFSGFQCGLLSASRQCSSDALSLAFPLDGTHAPVGVRLREVKGSIEAEVFGTNDVDRVRTQVARMLSVEHDARPFAALVSRTPALKNASDGEPGFRPPIFYSPYAAAGWLVLTQRLQQRQAAKLQEALARESGDVVEVGGVSLASFPRPESFLSRRGFPGIPDTKWARLQAVAKAALEGQLDIERLRALSQEEALEHLQGIHGIGAWTAAGVWLRGVGLTDSFIVEEPQVHAATALAWGLDHTPDDDELTEIAEAWRPFRSWVSVLLTMAWYRAGPLKGPGATLGFARGQKRPSKKSRQGALFSTARATTATK